MPYSLPGLQKRPNTAPKSIAEGVEYGRYCLSPCGALRALLAYMHCRAGSSWCGYLLLLVLLPTND